MKKIYTILSGIIMLSLFIASASAATNWPFDKTQTCAVLNSTGASCDQTWCSVINCDYNENLTACICNGDSSTIGNAILDNSTYYNRSDVDFLLKNQSEHLEGVFNNLTIGLRDSLANRLDNLTYDVNLAKQNQVYSSPTTNSQTPGWVWPTSLIVIAGIFGFIYYSNSKAKQFHQPQTAVRKPIKKREFMPHKDYPKQEKKRPQTPEDYQKRDEQEADEPEEEDYEGEED